MNIQIKSIPHASQRYPTCGDWYFENGSLIINVSEEMGDDSCFLVAIHELVEVWLATKRGVTVEEVDKFDIEYEKAHRIGGTLEGCRIDETEPGYDPTCPVFKEHGIATAIETLLCAEMNIPWPEHEKRVEALP